MEQIIETTINRLSKTCGGLSEITENVRANTKWLRLNHYLWAFKLHLDVRIGRKGIISHLELGSRKTNKDE